MKPTHASNAAANSAAPTPVRKRVRSVEGGKTETKVSVSLELKKLAAEHFRQNNIANAAKNAADKARTALYGGMKNDGVSSFDFDTTIDGKKVSLTSAIAPGRNTTVIDVVKLRKQGDEETFLKTVTATVGKVTEFYGSQVVAQCGTVVAGAENVSVKPTK
jgi:hypothetical protein